jgi:hypothetical protein
MLPRLDARPQGSRARNGEANSFDKTRSDTRASGISRSPNEVDAPNLSWDKSLPCRVPPDPNVIRWGLVMCPSGVIQRIPPAWRVRTCSGVAPSVEARSGMCPGRPLDPEGSIGREARSDPIRSRYEITCLFVVISLRLLMPFPDFLRSNYSLTTA